VCILAGGLGTRLGSAAATTPKALTEVAGEPFLFRQLRLLARHRARKVVLCVGHLGEQIEAAIGSGRFGIDVRYSYDGPRLDGTLGALRRARPLLGDRFLVLYGDTYLRADYELFSEAWVKSGLSAGMTVLHNQGRWDRSNVIYEDGRIVRYEKGTDDPMMEWIDYGLGALRSEVLDLVGVGEHDLSALYRELARRSQLFGFEATERFFEIGTPAALAETTEFFVANKDG
jgi:NDP-sugar pyrophosphorylase family protein